MTATNQRGAVRCLTSPPYQPPAPCIETAIRARLQTTDKALVPYLMAGFPSEAQFIDAMRAAADAGSDVVEVGVPFSDPIADGPVIQYASQRCLDRGMTIRRALDAIDRAAIPMPVVLMSYLNPLLTYGCDRVARDARSVGVRGLVVPDLPMNGHPTYRRRSQRVPRVISAAPPLMQAVDQFRDAGLELILLAAPTTDAQRLLHIGRHTRGFLYAVTVTGVTGARRRMPPETTAFLRRARAATPHPVLGGFGVANATMAAQVAMHCDGVIIGSALIEILRQGPARTAAKLLHRFLVQIRRTFKKH